MGDDTKTETEDDDYVVKSPFASIACHIQPPLTSAPNYLLNALSLNYEVFKLKPWVIDAVRGTTVLFSEIEPLSYKLASALSKAGFKKGDWLYFVTYEVALIYIVQIAVWRCGGITRGCYQKELDGEFTRQLLETKAKFVLCDRETAAPVKRAISRLSWKVQLLSIGDVVADATSVEEMMNNDDGSQFPHDLVIDPKEDVLSVPNTSGSTGCPKGAMHTHFNLISFLANMGGPKKVEKSEVQVDALLTMMGNFSVGSLMHTSMACLFGYTVITISKFNKHSYLGYIMKYKPNSLALYHYVASWLARSAELEKNDLSFIKYIIGGGSVFDFSTVSLLCNKLPNMRFVQSYGMSETLVVTTSNADMVGRDVKETFDSVGGIKYIRTNDGSESGVFISCGVLFPQVKAKIVDVDTGKPLKRMSCGRLYLHCPFVMKGYLNFDIAKGAKSPVDENGWIDTGDLAFFDNQSHLYIIDRINHVYKYYMHQVSVVEIETVISEHPDVLAVGVVAIPNPETTSMARAYIVLKPGKSVKEEDILQYVAGKVVFYKQLHGGATFVNSLPMNSGGKLDRRALYNMAMAEIKQ